MQVQPVLVLLAFFFAFGYTEGANSLPATVSCSSKGEAAQFNTADCHKVANKLAQGSISKANCNSCALALVNPSSKQLFQFPHAVDSQLVIAAVDHVLSSCGSQAHQKRDAAGDHKQNNAPVVILARGNGSC